MIKANDPSLKSWVEIPLRSDFPIQNLPFGIFSLKDSYARVGVRIGDSVLDLSVIAREGYFKDVVVAEVFDADYLNDMMQCGKAGVRAIRNIVSELLAADNPALRDHAELRAEALYSIDEVTMHMPVKVGDYTDFLFE